MQISPGTPTGQQLALRVEDPNVVLAIGRPIGHAGASRLPHARRRSTRPWSRSVHTCSRPRRSAQQFMRPDRAGRLSPPTSALKVRPCQPASSSRRQVPASPACMVAPLSSSSCRERVPVDGVSRVATTISAPTGQRQNSSSTAMSNDSVVTASSRSSAIEPRLAPHAAAGNSRPRGAARARPSACRSSPRCRSRRRHRRRRR